VPKGILERTAAVSDPKVGKIRNANEVYDEGYGA